METQRKELGKIAGEDYPTLSNFHLRVCEFWKVICPSIIFLAYIYGYLSYARQCA